MTTSPADTMFKVSSTTTFSTNFQDLFNTALEAYEKKTKKHLLTHPLSAKLQRCDSPDAILSVFQELVQQFDQRRCNNERLRKCLNPIVNVLYAFSTTIGEGVGLGFPPARAIFAGIGVLLLAAKDVRASQDALADIFERIDSFFRRLESYAEVSPTAAMKETIVKILVEVLVILAIATKEIKQGRPKRYLKKVFGKNDMEDVLKRLDLLTQEEARMATAEVLKMTNGINDKANVLIDAEIRLQRAENVAVMAIQQQATRTAFFFFFTPRLPN